MPPLFRSSNRNRGSDEDSKGDCSSDGGSSASGSATNGGESNSPKEIRLTMFSRHDGRACDIDGSNHDDDRCDIESSDREKDDANLDPTKEQLPLLGSEIADSAAYLSSLPDEHGGSEPPLPVHPGRRLFQRWVLTRAVPFAIIAWILTHKIWVVVLAVIGIPFFALAQGGVHILVYRFGSGNKQPIPRVPTHGVVKVVSGGAVSDESKEDKRRPLRLLVIGDSLACGVGQCWSPTPIMPESIARSLSKAMGGRTILWTCRGAPGASAPWIVRELERAMDMNQSLSEDENGLFDEVNEVGAKYKSNTHADNDSDDSSFCSSVDGSVSNKSRLAKQKQDRHVVRTWHERLKQESILFNPHVVGPYDIAVVLTGGNDIKNAFFPFMLAGDDVEFWREARSRGGGFSMELGRILGTLQTKMRSRIDQLREKVETATDLVRDSVDNAMDRIGIEHRHRNRRSRSRSNGSNNSALPKHTYGSSGSQANGSSLRKIHPPHLSSVSSADSERYDDENDATRFPMIVLPGMPAPTLPIFRRGPLRWMTLPIVEAMDCHKRNLTERYNGEVIFVPAPSVESVFDYCRHQGEFWQEHRDETTLLNLRDIKRRHAQQIESDMRVFYREWANRPTEDEVPDEVAQARTDYHEGMFAKDGIHASDAGYDLWGRFIAKEIIEQWKKNEERVASEGV